MTKFCTLAGSAALMFLLSTGIPAPDNAQAASTGTSTEAVSPQGKVLQTMDSGGYTYLEIETKTGSAWAAVPQTQVEKGQEVHVQPGAVMNDFPSKTLNRTFKSIVFSSGFVGGKQISTPPAKTVASETGGGDSFQQALQQESGGGNPHSFGSDASGTMGSAVSSGAAVISSADVKVEKVDSENGYTVAEIHDKAKELNNKTVQVRGMVVKVSKMIMGKNWLHLQDGTGDPKANSHDLVVTTMADPAKKSIVVVEGELHAEKDFGHGYKYSVIVEDAVIK